jgi:hypothetical protein
MQYFVSAEKTPYFYWQLELLIYSFKRFNLEDRLVIGLAESDDGGSKAPKYLSKCRYMLHDNFGRSFGYSPLNKIYAVEMARNTGILKPPFVMIDPDMLMLLPILCDYDEDVIGNFSYAMDLENLQKNYQDKYEYVKKYENLWKPIGPIMLIKKDSKNLYKDVMSICLEMITNLKFWWPIEMLSWICGFCKNKMTIRSNKVFESYIHSNYDSNFIHYCHSEDFINQISLNNNDLNLFNKHQYKNLPKEVLAFEPYYDIIKSNLISENMFNMKKITKEFLENY